MVMKVDPLIKSIESIDGRSGPILVLSPAGEPFSAEMSKQLSRETDVTLVCGRYAGIDQRFVKLAQAREVSLGDYILSGGEPAALCVVDAVTRLLPGVLGHPKSAEEDSFFDGLLEAPCYTRPQEYQSKRVPDFLLSGDHAAIQKKRHWLSLIRTRQMRPELLSEQHLSDMRSAELWLSSLSEQDREGLGIEDWNRGEL